jgi:hypothetical protein
MSYLTIIGGPDIVAVRVDDFDATDRGHRLSLEGHRPIMLPIDWTFAIHEERPAKHPRDAEISFEELRARIAASR